MLNSPEIQSAVKTRPVPFTVSIHGDSTIILDGKGRWATGQIRRDEAEKLAASMTKMAVSIQ